MAIALFSSILPFSSRCRCSRNSLWISAYNPSLFFDGNRFVAFRIWRYRRSVERRDDICLLRLLLLLLLLLGGGGGGGGVGAVGGLAARARTRGISSASSDDDDDFSSYMILD